MAATQIVVVYCVSSSRALRTIIPDDDGEVAQIQGRLVPGEALVTLTKSLANGNFYIENLISLIAQQGGPSISPPVRCVLVDANGVVVDALMAEPALFTPPVAVTPAMTTQLAAANLAAVPVPQGPFSIIAHPVAAIGGTLINGTYTPPVVKVGTVV